MSTRYYQCPDGHACGQYFAEIMPHHMLTCNRFIPDPKLKGESGFMVLCDKPLTFLREEGGNSFAETYLQILANSRLRPLGGK